MACGCTHCPAARGLPGPMQGRGADSKLSAALNSAWGCKGRLTASGHLVRQGPALARSPMLGPGRAVLGAPGQEGIPCCGRSLRGGTAPQSSSGGGCQSGGAGVVLAGKGAASQRGAGPTPGEPGPPLQGGRVSSPATGPGFNPRRGQAWGCGRPGALLGAGRAVAGGQGLLSQLSCELWRRGSPGRLWPCRRSHGLSSDEVTGKGANKERAEGSPLRWALARVLCGWPQAGATALHPGLPTHAAAACTSLTALTGLGPCAMGAALGASRGREGCAPDVGVAGDCSPGAGCAGGLVPGCAGGGSC